MKERLKIFAAFGTSLCAVCAFLIAALILGSLNGCSYMGDAASATPPPPASTLEPSDQPSADPSQEPQLSTDPVPVQSTPASENVVVPPAQSTSIPVTQPSAQPSQSSPESGIQAVLQGNATFYSIDAAQNLTINELGRVVSDDSGITAKALKFAIVDLDGDGISEVILWLKVNENDSFGFEILRQQSGQIYGYTIYYKSFMDLKRDGTFSFSGGAADSGFGTISFSDKVYTINEITYSQSAYDANNELTTSYCVNGQDASENDYLAAVEEQNGKESVLWYDFTSENVVSALG